MNTGKNGAIDLGGTYIRAAILNEDWKIEKIIKETTAHGKNEIFLVNQICRMIGTLMEQEEEIESLKIGIPGVVERSGEIRYIANIPELTGIKLGEILEKELNIPVYCVNDANAAALGEALMGAGRGFESVYYITVSTGIGGGFVYRGHVMEGAFGYAGEAGGILVREIPEQKKAELEKFAEFLDRSSFDGKETKGLALFPGSVETQASGMAIVNQGSCITGKTKKHAGEIFDAARAGEDWADKLVDQMAWDLAVMCVNISYVINPNIFVFGGGCMTEDNPFFDRMCRYYRQIADERLERTRFSRAILSESGIIGAAMYGQGRTK